MTIYKSSTGPWRQAEKTIQTFRSGLIRVEQPYKALTSTVATDAAGFVVGAVLNVTSPAIDSLYIHPEPQWTEEAGGAFSTINVSAYGRARTGYVVEEELRSSTSTRAQVIPPNTLGFPPEGTTIITETTISKTHFVCRYVVAPGEEVPINSDVLKPSFKMYATDGTIYSPYQDGYTLQLSPLFEFSSAVNFGHFTEWTVVVTFIPLFTTQSYG